MLAKFYTPYLDKKSASTVQKYKYAGGDESWGNAYFWAPLACYLAQFLPEWLAPNLMTLIGFIKALIPFFTMYGFFGSSMSDEESNPLPRWVFFLQTACFFLYRVWDDLDGKQARQTGNSSPLGMLFDHGVDSIVVGANTLIAAKCIDAGDTVLCLVAYISVISVFWAAMLEEYHKGILILPFGNGISDGSIGLLTAYFMFGLYGNSYLKQPATQLLGYDLRVTDVWLICLMVGNARSIIRSIGEVFKARGTPAPEGLYKEPFVWSHFLTLLFSYVILMIGIVGLTVIGKKPIHSNPRPEGQLSLMFPISLLALSAQSYLSISMQVKHVTRQRFLPFRDGPLRFIYAGIFLIYVIVAMEDRIGGRQVSMMAWAILVIFLALKWHFIICIIVQMKEICGIRVFHVKDKQA